MSLSHSGGLWQAKACSMHLPCGKRTKSSCMSQQTSDKACVQQSLGLRTYQVFASLNSHLKPVLHPDATTSAQRPQSPGERQTEANPDLHHLLKMYKEEREQLSKDVLYYKQSCKDLKRKLKAEVSLCHSIFSQFCMSYSFLCGV